MGVTRPRQTGEPVLLWAPLCAMPFMLNLRWDAMMAPSEEPKWAVFMLLMVVLAVAGAMAIYRQCRRAGPADAPVLSLPGLLFLLFFAGLAYGVTYAANPGEGWNRLAFWCAGGLTFWATARMARREPEFPQYLQIAITLTALVLCLHFWYGFFVDFSDPAFDKFVQFSRIGHFNFTADVLVVLIPLLAWTVLSHGGWIRGLAAGFALLTTGFMLLTSGSLGGMGGLAAGGLLAGGLALLRRWMVHGHAGWRPGRRGLLTVLAIAVIVAVAARPVYQRIPKTYRDQIFSRAEWWTKPRAQDLNQAQALPPLTPLWMAMMPYLGARTPMWASTAGMVAEHPWRGFGTGSFQVEYTGFNKRYPLFRDPETLGVRIKTNPHNILLQLAADNGLPLTLLFAGLYLWLTVRVMRQAWCEPTGFWWCGVWLLVAAGLDAQVNHVFFNPASLFMAAVGLGLLYGRLPVPAGSWTLPVCPVWRWPAAPMLAGGAALALALFPLRWVASEYYVAEATRLELGQSASPRHIRLTWQAAVDWSPDNTRAVYGLASSYYGQRDLTEAERWLQKFLRLSPNHTPAFNLLATIQAHLDRLDEAEATLTHALQIEPDAQALTLNLKNLRKHREQKSAQPPAPSAAPAPVSAPPAPQPAP